MEVTGRFVYRFIISGQMAFYWKDGSRIIEVGSLGDQTAMEFISSFLRSTLRCANGFQSHTTNLLLEPFGEKLLLEFTASSIEYVVIGNSSPAAKNWCAVQQNKTVLESTENLLHFRTGRMPSVKSSVAIIPSVL